MKRFLLFLLLCLSWNAFGQAPYQRNTYTTNAAGKAPNTMVTTTSPLYPLMILKPDGSGVERTIQYAPAFHIDSGVAKLDGGATIGTLTPGSIVGANGGTNLFSVTLGSGLDFTAGTLSAPAQNLWTNYTGTDAEGGTVQIIESKLQPPQVRFARNYLTNFFSDNSSVMLIGYIPSMIPMDIATNNSTVFGIGDYALNQSQLSHASEIYAIGDVLGNSKVTNSSRVFAIGSGVLGTAQLTNSSDIYVVGSSAMSSAVLSNSSDIYALGKQAGQGLAGDGLSHIFMAGSGSQPTDSGDWVAGDDQYRYKFPGTAGATFTGPLKLSGTTNQYTDDGTQLLRNGSPVSGGGSSTTNYYSTTVTTNSYSISNYFTVGKGGKLTITNSIALGDYFIYPLQAGTGITFTTNANPTSGTNITIAASGGGGGSALYVNGTSVTNANLKDGAFTVWDTAVVTNLTIRPLATVTTLTWSGTNLAGMDLAASKVWKITLTNNAFIGTSTLANLPTAAQYGEWVLMAQEDSTGGYFLNFTNSVFEFAEGVQPVKTTNANAVDYYYFHTSIGNTNGNLVANMNQNCHR